MTPLPWPPRTPAIAAAWLATVADHPHRTLSDAEVAEEMRQESIAADRKWERENGRADWRDKAGAA